MSTDNMDIINICCETVRMTAIVPVGKNTLSPVDETGCVQDIESTYIICDISFSVASLIVMCVKASQKDIASLKHYRKLHADERIELFLTK